MRLAVAQLWLANAGLALLVAGFGARAHGERASIYLLAIGGVLGTVAAYVFMYNIWRTLEGSPPVRRKLPTAG